MQGQQGTAQEKRQDRGTTLVWKAQHFNFRRFYRVLIFLLLLFFFSFSVCKYNSLFGIIASVTFCCDLAKECTSNLVVLFLCTSSRYFFSLGLSPERHYFFVGALFYSLAEEFGSIFCYFFTLSLFSLCVAVTSVLHYSSLSMHVPALFPPAIRIFLIIFLVKRARNALTTRNEIHGSQLSQCNGIVFVNSCGAAPHSCYPF